MKKIILALAIPLAIVACGGGGPQGDAEKMCSLMKEYKAAIESKNEAEKKRIDAEGEKMEDELQEKYKNDTEGKKKFTEKLNECRAALK
jgi:hypothetical protein